jgi:putative ABC transport system permease protein
MNRHTFLEYFTLAWGNLRHRKKRAWLTIIGIFIGIMAVVALFSLGRGLEQGVSDEFAKLGVDKVFVRPDALFGSAPAPFTDKDVEAISSINEVQEVIGVPYRTARVEWEEELGFYYIAGAPERADEMQLLEEAFMLDVVEGRQLEPGDKYRAVVGYDYFQKEKFENTMQLGSKFMINNVTFTVVGLRKRIGNEYDDRQIVIPIEAYREAISDGDEYDMIIARTVSGTTDEELTGHITKELRRSRDVRAGEEDFSVDTAQDLQNSFDDVLGIITLVLSGIALISLLVGSVGIMNTMYTAVLERTREIGIMKAVGATNEAILSIFLIESGLLGLAGGIVGVTLGLGISFGTAFAAQQTLGTSIIQAYVSWWLIVGALLFSFLLGALSGLLPARQAAHMKPVDSLRYE